MSHIEYHFGRFREIPNTDNKPIEELCKQIAITRKWTTSGYYKDYLIDSGEYIIVKNRLFEIFYHVTSEQNNFNLVKNSDNSYTFSGPFFNNNDMSLQNLLQHHLNALLNKGYNVDIPLPEPINEQGYTSKELIDICKLYNINEDIFNEALGINTASCDESGQILTYKIDVINTLNFIKNKHYLFFD